MKKVFIGIISTAILMSSTTGVFAATRYTSKYTNNNSYINSIMKYKNKNGSNFDVYLENGCFKFKRTDNNNNDCVNGNCDNNCTNNSCTNNNNCNNNNNKPETEKPGTNKPGNSKPETDKPGNSKPETDKPENNKPETDKPENNKPGNNKPGNNNTNNDNSQSSTASYQQQVLELVNEHRAAYGLSALTMDSKVQAAANLRTNEIIKSFSHTRPDGRAFNTALTEVGATYKGAGENIAKGQKTPEEVVTAWMNSEGHRANILNSKYKYLGVGCIKSQNGYAWTQIFTY